MASKRSAPRSGVGPNQEKPALLTRMSTLPASSARRVTAPASPTSAATKRARPRSAEIASTTVVPRPASRPWTTTSAPSRARRSAIARPIPEVAPVTSALWPSRVLRLLVLMDDMATPYGLSDDGLAVNDADAHLDSVSVSVTTCGEGGRLPGLAPCRLFDHLRDRVTPRDHREMPSPDVGDMGVGTVRHEQLDRRRNRVDRANQIAARNRLPRR